jgi:hypothetical protein
MTALGIEEEEEEMEEEQEEEQGGVLQTHGALVDKFEKL